MYPHPGGPLLRRLDRNAHTDALLCSQLAQTSALAYPHHGTYEFIDPDLERNVEICASWRVYIEELDFSMKQLRDGKKFGFIGSSDSHRAVPGLGGALTGIYAEALTPDALFDAYRNRRIFATQGCFIFMDFRVGELFMGQEGSGDRPPAITGQIEAPKPIEFFEIIRDGEAIFKQKPNTEKTSFAFHDETADPEDHFYFLRVKLAGDLSYNTDPAQNSYRVFEPSEGNYPHNGARAHGVLAWSSPIWVSQKP